MNIQDLLNPAPVEALTDISENIARLQNYISRHSFLLAPNDLARDIQMLVDSLPLPEPFHRRSSLRPSPSSSTSSLPDAPDPPTVESDVYVNRQTTLSKLYRYEDIHASLEYPETHPHNPVGYLHRLDPSPDSWLDPVSDTAYSWGMPSGQNFLTHPLLVDGDGNLVPCIETHGTCQGVKVCPFTNVDELRRDPHCSASREDIAERLADERENRLAEESPRADLFKRTLAFLTAFRRMGCRAEELETTHIPIGEEEDAEEIRRHNAFLQRGYVDKVVRCVGRICFNYDAEGKPLVHCEHYDAHTSRTHYVEYLDESHIDVEYLEAVLTDDVEGVRQIELEAQDYGYGPRAQCTVMVNTTSRRINCPFDHRHTDETISQPVMTRLSCKVRYRIFEPLEEYRTACPYVFISYLGEHTHPIPLPSTTPKRIRSEIFELFYRMDEDVADLTARRFIRHPLTRAYVRSKHPENTSATLADVHISLGNREHLGMYIRQIKQELFPEGTGWQGACHLRTQEVAGYPVEEKYIRRILTVDPATLYIHPDDEQTDSTDGSDLLKIIICMDPAGSRRFQKASYVQSDISYKRVVGFREFVIGHWDRDAHSSLVFCRVYMNRETAAAHELVFRELDNIIIEDTGSPLRWRHLDAQSVDDFKDCILQWTGDQGGGQAKGLGLHLKSLAQFRQPKNDLHEPLRLISSLNEYEHLHRVFRLCATHAKRNIRRCNVPESVRNKMRGLICLQHPDWDDWLSNKLASKFALEGLCWEKSKIPLDVWQAGDRSDNLIESSHFDVNQDGRACSLVAGMEKGRRFDLMKLRSIKAIEESGIRPSYSSGHPSENLRRALKRKQLAWASTLRAEDQKIESYNAKFEAAHRKHIKSFEALRSQASKWQAALQRNATPTEMEKLRGKWVRAEATYKKDGEAWNKLVQDTIPTLPTGSGKVAALTFQDIFP